MVLIAGSTSQIALHHNMKIVTKAMAKIYYPSHDFFVNLVLLFNKKGFLQ